MKSCQVGKRQEQDEQYSKVSIERPESKQNSTRPHKSYTKLQTDVTRYQYFKRTS